MEQALTRWNVKYGEEGDVQQLLTDYSTFMSKHNVFNEYNKMFTQLQQTSDAYKRDGKLGEFKISKFKTWPGWRFYNEWYHDKLDCFSVLRIY